MKKLEKITLFKFQTLENTIMNKIHGGAAKPTETHQMLINLNKKKYCFFSWKHTFFLLLLFSFKSNIFGQSKKSYLEYYTLENEAVYFKSINQKEKALNFYLKAFSKFRGFENDYTIAINLALELGRNNLAFKLLKQKMLKTGWFSDELFVKEFEIFIKTNLGKKYLKYRDEWKKLNKKTIEPISYGLCKQIDATDQLIRGGKIETYLKPIKNDSLIDLIYWNIFSKTDSLNFLLFKRNLIYNGFPGINQTGGKELIGTFIIHVFKYKRDGKFKNEFDKENYYFLDSLLKIQVLNGNLSNNTFAYSYDYSLTTDSISYYAYPRFFRNDLGKRVLINYPVIDPENLNKRRAEIGLMTIEKQCQVYNSQLPPNYKNKNE